MASFAAYMRLVRAARRVWCSNRCAEPPAPAPRSTLVRLPVFVSAPAGGQRALRGAVLHPGARAQVNPLRHGHKGTPRGRRRSPLHALGLRTRCPSASRCTTTGHRRASATRARRRRCASASRGRRCVCARRLWHAHAHSTLSSPARKRLDVDAGLETMRLVRDVGNPALRRRDAAGARAAARERSALTQRGTRVQDELEPCGGDAQPGAAEAEARARWRVVRPPAAAHLSSSVLCLIRDRLLQSHAAGLLLLAPRCRLQHAADAGPAALLCSWAAACTSLQRACRRTAAAAGRARACRRARGAI